MAEVTSSSTESRLRRIVAEYAELDPAKLTANTRWSDLPLNDRDVPGSVLNVESEFNITCDEESALGQIRNFGQLTRFIDEFLATR